MLPWWWLPSSYIEWNMNKIQPAKNRSGNLRTGLGGFKDFLGMFAAPYSDAQLLQLRREMHAMAELLLDLYLYKKRDAAATKKTKDFDIPSPRS